MDRQMREAGVVGALIAYGRHGVGDVWAYRCRDELGPEFELLDPEEIRRGPGSVRECCAGRFWAVIDSRN
jgi:hypothetical protein